jgi:hypothetical protein
MPQQGMQPQNTGVTQPNGGTGQGWQAPWQPIWGV